MNNLDMSSAGENISLQVEYDSDLSQMYYQDFIDGADGNSVYKIESRREVIAYLIGDYDKPFYTKTALNKMKKDDLLDLWFQYELGYNETGCTKADFISDISRVTIARYYDYVFKEVQSRYVDEHIQHPHFTSRGYCQDDAVQIIDVGADYDVIKQSESIDHILWDTPVSIILTIDDNEEFYDLSNDVYEYDAQSIIENVNKLDISDYAKNWIAENMPTEPAYN